MKFDSIGRHIEKIRVNTYIEFREGPFLAGGESNLWGMKTLRPCPSACPEMHNAGTENPGDRRAQAWRGFSPA